MTRVLAAADIGSNTAHLLVAATDGTLVMRLDNYNEWIPLGEVVAREGSIPKELAQQLVLAVKEFKRVAKELRAEQLYVFGTEGLRLAHNHQQMIERIGAEAGVPVEVISPQREAELSLAGTWLDTRNYGAELLFEVGGGSVQIGRIVRHKLIEEESLPLGTGRIIAESGMGNPCSDIALEAAERYIDSVLDRSRFKLGPGVSVASGGVARGLMRALHPDGEKWIAIQEIEHMAWTAARLPADRLIARFGVKSKRASTLLPGSLVFRALMRRFDLEQIVISEFGIREGAILGMAGGEIVGCPV